MYTYAEVLNYTVKYTYLKKIQNTHTYSYLRIRLNTLQYVDYIFIRKYAHAWLRPRLKIALSCLGLSLFWQEKFVSAVVKEIKFKNYFCSMKIVLVEKKFSSKSGSVEQLYRKSNSGECLLLYKKKPGKLTLGSKYWLNYWHTSFNKGK